VKVGKAKRFAPAVLDEPEKVFEAHHHHLLFSNFFESWLVRLDAFGS
jgi:hypothetical protein